MDNSLFFSNDQTPAERNFNAQLLSYCSFLYSEEGRFYHNFDHIKEMIIIGKEIFNLTFQQYLAILFHDSVYDAKSHINEENSIQRMFHLISSLRGPMELSDLQFFGIVAAIIKDTKGHFYPTLEASRVVLDLDLERLARPLADVQHFSNLIRQEYAHVSDEDFNRGRKEFYRKFLSIDPVFSTDYGRRVWEPKAKENVQILLNMM